MAEPRHRRPRPTPRPRPSRWLIRNCGLELKATGGAAEWSLIPDVVAALTSAPLLTSSSTIRTSVCRQRTTAGTPYSFLAFTSPPCRSPLQRLTPPLRRPTKRRARVACVGGNCERNNWQSKDGSKSLDSPRPETPIELGLTTPGYPTSEWSIEFTLALQLRKAKTVKGIAVNDAAYGEPSDMRRSKSCFRKTGDFVLWFMHFLDTPECRRVTLCASSWSRACHRPSPTARTTCRGRFAGSWPWLRRYPGRRTRRSAATNPGI